MSHVQRQGFTEGCPRSGGDDQDEAQKLKDDIARHVGNIQAITNKVSLIGSRMSVLEEKHQVCDDFNDSRGLEKSSSYVIGYGMVSHCVTFCHQELWRAMLSFLCRPADYTMHVDGVPFEVKVGDVMMSMRLIPKQGVDGQRLRRLKPAPETTLRSIMGGVDGTEERVLFLRTEPPHCEIHCHEVPVEMRVTWKKVPSSQRHESRS